MKRITKVECEIGFELTLMHIRTMGSLLCMCIIFARKNGECLYTLEHW